MKRHFNRENLLTALVLAAVAAMAILVNHLAGGDGGELTAMALVAGIAGGTHVSGEPLTTSLTAEGSPDLLLNEIDRRIVKVRPMATPIDQISRQARVRRAGSMIVDYYSVDTKKTSTKAIRCSVAEDSDDSNGYELWQLKTQDDSIFEPSETILLPDVDATDADGSVAPLVLYVVERSAQGLRVQAVNHVVDGVHTLPSIPVSATVVRMGRAAAELDVQTAQFASLPVKRSNYCQIFKAQVEQSTYQKIANKEADWGFSDQEEAAIIDMRLGMEKNFLFGARCKVYDAGKRDDIYLTGGIWAQAGKEASYSDTLTAADLVHICREAFTGQGGSSKKLLIGGTGFIEQLHGLDHQRVLTAQDTLTRWGLDFTEVVSKFGRLYVLASEVFDECGHADDAMIIDPEYITKYCHVPFSTERLDLRASGQRNTDAIVLTEASCLVLRYPNAHMRIISR